jgi:hypothetical protein
MPTAADADETEPETEIVRQVEISANPLDDGGNLLGTLLSTSVRPRCSSGSACACSRARTGKTLARAVAGEAGCRSSR